MGERVREESLVGEGGLLRRSSARACGPLRRGRPRDGWVSKGRPGAGRFVGEARGPVVP